MTVLLAALAILLGLLLVDLVARRRRLRAQLEALRARDRIRRREEHEHAARVWRLGIVGGVRPDVRQQGTLSPRPAGRDSAGSGLRVNVPEPSPRDD